MTDLEITKACAEALEAKVRAVLDSVSALEVFSRENPNDFARMPTYIQVINKRLFDEIRALRSPELNAAPQDSVTERNGREQPETAPSIPVGAAPDRSPGGGAMPEEPVAWMTTDGRVVTSETKADMHRRIAESHVIPLYRRPAPSAGMVMVPRELTIEMENAGDKADRDYSNNRFHGKGHLGRVAFIYDAMLAAPLQPGAGKEG